MTRTASTFLTAMRLRRWLRLVVERGEACDLLERLERAEVALWASIRESITTALAPQL